MGCCTYIAGYVKAMAGLQVAAEYHMFQSQRVDRSAVSRRGHEMEDK